MATPRACACAVLAVCLVVPGGALATKVRVAALGGAEKQVTVADESNVQLFPTLLVHYGNRVFVDRVRPDEPLVEFGTHWTLGPHTVLGVYGGAQSWLVAGRAIAYPDRFEGSGQRKTAVAGALGAVQTDLKALALVAHDFGLWRGGLLLAAFADTGRRKDETGDNDRNALFFDLRLGFGFELGRDGSLDLALRGGVGTFEQHAVAAAGNTAPPVFGADGIWGVGIVARADIPATRTVAVVPYAELGYESEAVRESGGPAKATWRGWNARLGADVRIEPWPGVRLYPGLGAWLTTGRLSAGADVPLDERRMALPYYGFAAEVEPARWVALRFGARQTILFEHFEEDLAGAERLLKSSEVLTEFSLGAGFTFAGFTIDLLLSRDFLNRGPYLLSGRETPVLNSEVALKYAW